VSAIAAVQAGQCGPSSGGSASALKAQINHDQVRLADWEACVSAKTPAGKAQIKTISDRISAAREQVLRIEAAHAKSSEAVSLSASASSAANAGGVSPSAPDGNQITVVRDQPGATEAQRRRVDVWA
jgi:hypothetical protein